MVSSQVNRSNHISKDILLEKLAKKIPSRHLWDFSKT